MKNEIVSFRKYLIQRNMSKNTVENYTRDLVHFFNTVNISINEVTFHHIEDYINCLKRDNNSTSTTNRKLSSIKAFFKFCVREGIVSSSPASIVESGKLEKRLPKTLDADEVDEFINSAECLRDRVIFEILYGTGVRREELVSIRVSDINFKRGIIRIIGKGNKERIIPIHSSALELIKELSESQNSVWLFPSMKVLGGHISKRRLNEIVKKYADKLGYEGITPHKFRHSFGTVMYDSGADIKAIGDMMGHESVNTTNIYAKVSISRNQKEYLKYHPRAKNAVSY